MGKRAEGRAEAAWRRKEEETWKCRGGRGEGSGSSFGYGSDPG